MDTSKGILRGRPYGGVALLWDNNRLDRASVIPCNSDRIVAVNLSASGRCILRSVDSEICRHPLSVPITSKCKLFGFWDYPKVLFIGDGVQEYKQLKLLERAGDKGEEGGLGHGLFYTQSVLESIGKIIYFL
ncbi:unnamed protein product [Leptidea sinapis]|uniref:Uncharacterized protein n=1 Tax=Leptidea sinapis TaxID=189913 RepID=A0A5E4QWN1_9NEOP|nr:unnamed protein product [Leptidea sinapis]